MEALCLVCGARRPQLMRDSLGSVQPSVPMLSLLLALTIRPPVVAQVPRQEPPAHFGIVFHVPDGSADKIPAVYHDGRFDRDTNRTDLMIGRPLRGTSTHGARVEVVLDSSNTSDEPFASEYHAHILGGRSLDTAEAVLFNDADLSITVSQLRPTTLDSTAARAIRARVLLLHNKALRYDPEVLGHDTLIFHPPNAVTSDGDPAVLVVMYPITLARKKALSGPTDDRASAFAIYSAARHEVLYAAFGHPEWAPTATSVNAVFPMFTFSIVGDSHLYLLAGYETAWESNGAQWVVFDYSRGQPITAPELVE